QTYTAFELIICDNASTDGTRSICERFAALDRRIIYARHERNLGAAENFNESFRLARGRYFKWAAHDDVIAPLFLEKAVQALDAMPEAVLCSSVVSMINAQGQDLGTYDPGRLNTGSPQRHTRFWARLHESWCKEVFGLIRSESLRQTPMIGEYGDADRALVAELALLGPFIVLDDILFMNREHDKRYTRTAIHDPKANLAWYSSDRRSRFLMQRWVLYGAFFDAVRRQGGNRNDRIRCYLQIVRSLGVNWNFFLLVMDPLVAVEPRIFVYVKQFKRRLLGYKKWSTLFEDSSRL
ncbi:MAG: glycosyltransferase, partial [Pseudomonadota bacterium]